MTERMAGDAATSTSFPRSGICLPWGLALVCLLFSPLALSQESAEPEAQPTERSGTKEAKTVSEAVSKPEGTADKAKKDGDSDTARNAESGSKEPEAAEGESASVQANAAVVDAGAIKPKAQQCVAVERKKNGTDAAVQAVSAAAKRAEDEAAGAELAELNREVATFSEQIEEFRGDVKRIVEMQYERRRRRIKGRYSKLIKDLTEEERTRRMSAIGRFEKFLSKYPNNKRYTPDALFRLAELYFEESNDSYIAATEKFDELSLAYDEARLKSNRPPEQNYSRTIALFDHLINSWPGYRNIDGAFYLKGYCQAEMGDVERSRKSFLALVERFPKSRFAPETWTRVGEYFFDANRLTDAINAYSKVLAFKESGYYDKALYKLVDLLSKRPIEAITKFRTLIDFSDRKAKQTGKAGSDLRASYSICDLTAGRRLERRRRARRGRRISACDAVCHW